MPTDVRKPFLHDSEELDLLVRREPHRRIDVEVDSELAVGREEVDVPLQRRVERCRSGRGRQRENGEASFLLRCGRRLLEARDRRVATRAVHVLEHRRVRRDGEEVLREAVADLARDACSLLGDRAAELGEPDRAPRADQEHAVCDQAQEIALRHEPAAQKRCEHVVQRREQHQRGAECEPAVEVLALALEPQAEADDGEQVQERLRGECSGQERRCLIARAGCDRRERVRRGAEERPDQQERDAGRKQRRSEHPLARLAPAARERRGGDQHPGEQPTDDARPALGPMQRLTAEDGRDRERERGEARDEEAAREQEVEAAPLDRKPDSGKDGDDPRRDDDHRLEHEAHLRQRPVRLQVVMGDKQRERRAEQAEQEDLAPEECLEIFSAVLPHVHLVGRRAPADKACSRCPSGSFSSTTTR